MSNWNGTIEWDAVAAAGFAFAFCKSSEGVSFSDPTFARNWTELRRLGLPHGCYHFARPDKNTAEAEAAFFLARIAVLGDLEPGEMVVLDLETGSGDLGAWALTWLQTVEAAVGFRPLLYSGAWFMEPNGLTGDPRLSQYGLWLAAYQVRLPDTPPSWPFWAFWQTSGSGTVPGVAGDCDIDVFAGNAAQLALYGKPEPLPPPVDDKDAQIAQLQAEAADLVRQRDAAYARISSGLAATSSVITALQG